MGQKNILDSFLEEVYQAQGPEGVVEAFSFLFGAFVITKDGVVVGANQAFFELIEYDQSELYGMHALQLITPDEGDAMKTRFATDDSTPYHLKLLPKSTKIKYVIVSPRVFHVADDTYRLAEFIDNTQNKLAEQSHIKSNASLLETEKLANIGSWQLDVVAGSFQVSKQWQKIHGIKKSRLPMDELMPIAHADDAEAINTAFQSVLELKVPRYDIEHRIIRQDSGEVRFVRAIAEVSETNDSGEPVRLTGFAQDITEQVAAKEELKISDEIVSATSDMLAEIDSDGKYKAVNEAYAAAFGLKRSDLHGMKVVEVFGQDFFDSVIQPNIDKVSGGEAIRYQDWFDFPATGRKYMDISYTPLMSVSGKFEKFIVSARDISKLKEIELKLESLLSEKDILIEEIDHRVKNNLQIIVSLLSIQARSEKDAHSVEALEASKRRIQVMANLHEKLHQSKNKRSVNIRDYLEAIVQDTISSYGHQEKLSCKLDVEAINFSISQSMALGQIISELISNCIKHAFAETEFGHISLSLCRIGDGKIRLSISDEGKGFPEEFNFQTTHTLGLKLVNSLIQQLHGEVSIENNGGATIKIVFKGGAIP